MVTFSDADLTGWITAFLLPFFRILALFTAAPVLSIRSVPARARIGLSVLIAVTVAPTVNAPAALALTSLQGLAWVAQEVCVGLAIGFSARLVFAAFDLAGEVIGLQMGLSFAGYFDPQGETGTAVGSFVTTLITWMFVSLNGPLLLIAATVRSFNSLPVGDVPFAFASRFDPMTLGAEVFALGLLIALPFLTLILFVNVLLGVMSRVAPQLTLFSIGFPITIGAGLVLLAVTLPWLEQPLTDALSRLLIRLGG